MGTSQNDNPIHVSVFGSTTTPSSMENLVFSTKHVVSLTTLSFLCVFWKKKVSTCCNN